MSHNITTQFFFSFFSYDIKNRDQCLKSSLKFIILTIEFSEREERHRRQETHENSFFYTFYIFTIHKMKFVFFTHIYRSSFIIIICVFYIHAKIFDNCFILYVRTKRSGADFQMTISFYVPEIKCNNFLEGREMKENWEIWKKGWKVLKLPSSVISSGVFLRFSLYTKYKKNVV